MEPGQGWHLRITFCSSTLRLHWLTGLLFVRGQGSALAEEKTSRQWPIAVFIAANSLGRSKRRYRRSGSRHESWPGKMSGFPTYPPLAPNREPSLWTKEMAATKCGHLDSALCGSLNFHRRHVTRHALPLAVRHLHPGVSPTHMFIHRLSRCVSTF